MGNDDSPVVRRDFRKNPITLDEQLHCIWYVVKDDLIGGWITSNVNKPASQQDPYAGEFYFSEFASKEVAEHIANLHNRWWREYLDESYKDNFLATWARESDEFYEAELKRKPWPVDSFDDLD